MNRISAIKALVRFVRYLRHREPDYTVVNYLLKAEKYLIEGFLEAREREEKGNRA
jgi:hypothetical protein